MEDLLVSQAKVHTVCGYDAPWKKPNKANPTYLQLGLRDLPCSLFVILYRVSMPILANLSDLRSTKS